MRGTRGIPEPNGVPSDAIFLLEQRSGSTLKKNGAKRPRFRAFREQLFYLEHTVEIFGDRDKLVAIGIQDRIIVILHRVNTQLVITAGL